MIEEVISEGIIVEVGIFHSSLELADTITNIRDTWDWQLYEEPLGMNLNPKYRLIVGPFSTNSEAKRAKRWLNETYGLQAVIKKGALPTEGGDEASFTVSMSQLAPRLVSMREEGASLSILETVVSRATHLNPGRRSEIGKTVFSSFKDIEPEFALRHGREYAEEGADERFLTVYIDRMRRAGHHDEALELIMNAISHSGSDTLVKAAVNLYAERQKGALLSLSTAGLDALLTRINEDFNQTISEQDVYRLLFIALRNDRTKDDIRYEVARRYVEKFHKDGGFLKDLSEVAFRRGDLRTSLHWAEFGADDKRLTRDLERGRDLVRLLEHGYPMPAKRVPKESPQKNSVLYVAYTSVPHHVSGYATRTHNLLKTMRFQGWNVSCITRLGYPFGESTLERPMTEIIEGITYHRIDPEGKLKSKQLGDRIRLQAEAIINHAREYGVPSIIHAASNHVSGLSAAHAAKILGVPFIYEVRGLWEITRVSKDPEWEGTDHHRLLSNLELQACLEADEVVCITAALGDELVGRGVPSSKITISPNGVDERSFKPTLTDRELLSELGISNDEVVIGYAGSIVPYEGLELLVDVLSTFGELTNWKAVIVGDGSSRGNLKEKIRQYGLEDKILLPGKVPMEDVPRWYSIFDITPFPRIPSPVTEMVSPLKPFEAMASGKAVLVSDVAAMKEYTIEGENAISFKKGDKDDLGATLRNLIQDNSLRARLAVSARRWVESESTWYSATLPIMELWDSLVIGRDPVVLVAGHDLKFISALQERFAVRNNTMVTDRWKGHFKHDENQSKRLLGQADIVICEWCLGNAVWYSQNLKSDQRLIIRFHRQELETEYPHSIAWSNVDAIVFITPGVMETAIKQFQIPREKCFFIPNYVRFDELDLAKQPDARFTIGLVGSVPMMKRLDKALNVLEYLRSVDSRFRLVIAGKRAEEHAWMLSRETEMEFFTQQDKRIATSNLLRDAVEFSGWTSMPEWMTNVGFVLSTSDFEGSHQAVAEGAASGALPVILPWQGASDLYPATWIQPDERHMAALILRISADAGGFNRASKSVRKFAENRFTVDIISSKWMELLYLG